MLINNHGAEIMKMERDFVEVDESPFEFEQLFSISQNPAPIITVGGTSTNSYDVNTQSGEQGMVGQIHPRTHYVQFKERIAGADIVLPQSIMRDSAMVSRLLADEISSLKAVINREAMSVFANVTNSGSEWAGWDGKPLLDNAHPLTDGSTNDNLITGAFSESNWVTAVETYINMKNISGVPYFRTPDGILVGVDNHIDALKLRGSTHVPGSNHNDINLASGTRVVTSVHLPANYWFVFNTASMAGELMFFYQEPPRIMLNAARENTLNVIIPTRVVYSFGFRNHNFIVGSTST